MDPVATVVLIFTAALVVAIAVFAKSRRDAMPDATTAAPSQPAPTPTATSVNPVGAVLSLLVAGWVIWYFAFGGLERDSAKQLQEIHTQVATDFAGQYDIAKRNGSAMDACVAAGIAAAGALQAKDEASYQRWKATERADCARAGVPK